MCGVQFTRRLAADYRVTDASIHETAPFGARISAACSAGTNGFKSSTSLLFARMMITAMLKRAIGC
jgi:hypothetical protein